MPLGMLKLRVRIKRDRHTHTHAHTCIQHAINCVYERGKERERERAEGAGAMGKAKKCETKLTSHILRKLLVCNLNLRHLHSMCGSNETQ